MKCGELGHRITINTLGAASADGYGGTTYAASTTATVWCDASQLSQRDSIVFGLDLNTAAYRFRFRYETAKNVTLKDTLTYENRTFRIVKINEVDEAKTEIIIIANERAN